MSDEPLAREGEPIERVRARLEALAMANAAPRCGARSKRTGKPCRAAAMPNERCAIQAYRQALPSSSHAERAVLDPSVQASPAEQQPCRTAGARFTAARVLGRGRRRA